MLGFPTQYRYYSTVDSQTINVRQYFMDTVDGIDVYKKSLPIVSVTSMGRQFFFPPTISK